MREWGNGAGNPTAMNTVSSPIFTSLDTLASLRSMLKTKGSLIPPCDWR